MTQNANHAGVSNLADEDLETVSGGLLQPEIVKPIIKPEMLVDPNIAQYFVPHINIVPKG